MRWLCRRLALRVARVVALCVLLAPAAAFGQATITGVVKDPSGGVLPGVTVEAASPALIEKMRSVVTDSTGQYRIVDLRPGSYSLTFTLPGFSGIKRDGIELAGSFTATVDAVLRIGSVEETITVTGESPIVDVQTTTRQQVVNHDVIDAIPTGRLPTQLAVLIPGVSNAGSTGFNGMGPQDVGGAGGDQNVTLSAHGGRGGDQRVTQNGLSVAAGAANLSAYSPNLGATQEVSVDVAGISAEATEGGVRINLVPKEGGNTFQGSTFFTFANDSMANSNFDDDLRIRGFTTPNAIRRVMEINPAFGGPVRKDRLWFFTSFRRQIADNWVGGMFADPNWNDPSVATFTPDERKPVSNNGTWDVFNARVTWQAASKHKFAFGLAKERQCKCPSFLSATQSTGINNKWGWPHYLLTADWTSPISNRLLLEGGLLKQYTKWGWYPLDGMHPNLVGVTEQSTGILSKIGWLPNFTENTENYWRYRAAASYVTGAHAFKAGFSNSVGRTTRYLYNGPYPGGIPMDFRVNNGIPNQITLRATPYTDIYDLDAELGVFAQDKWTIDRLTLSGGIRFDYYKSHFPENRLGPTPLFPNRDITFSNTPNLNRTDVTPRMGAAYDLFGNGKTAVKATLNKYLASGGAGGFNNPITTLVTITTRAWNDANRNFIPDCNLTEPVANGECLAMTDANFGKAITSTKFDPKVLSGFGVREFNWEFSTGVQHEILPRVSVDVGYFRRWYGNFLVTDDRSRGPDDYDSFSITAPSHPGLPGGGSYTIGGLHDVKATRFGTPADNYRTFARNYGRQIEHWNGVDVSLNARLGEGALLQGGISSGRTATNNCDVVAKLPEALVATNNAGVTTTTAPETFCDVKTPFLTQVKGLASYTVPKIGVRISGAFQSVPGPQLAANFVASNAVISPSLGRSLAGGGANATINLVKPGTMYGERMNQLDLRFGKPVRYGRVRTVLSVDVYNALNSNAVLLESNAYAIWRRPQVILVGRFFKISAQLDF